MYQTVFRLGLAVGPDIHIHFVSCEEKRREENRKITKCTKNVIKQGEYCDRIGVIFE